MKTSVDQLDQKKQLRRSMNQSTYQTLTHFRNRGYKPPDEGRVSGIGLQWSIDVTIGEFIGLIRVSQNIDFQLTQNTTGHLCSNIRLEKDIHTTAEMTPPMFVLLLAHAFADITNLSWGGEVYTGSIWEEVSGRG